MKDLRKAFGWSQEELAAALGKDVTTISRWERGKTRAPMTGTLIEQIARNGLSGRTTRLAAYLEIIMTPQLRASIDHHPGMRYLAFGPRLVLLRMSKLAASLVPSPISSLLIGAEYVPYMRDEDLVLYKRALPFLEEGPDTAKRFEVVKTYSRADGSKIKGHPKICREFIWTSPYPHVYDISARQISLEEYESVPDKLVLVPVGATASAA